MSISEQFCIILPSTEHLFMSVCVCVRFHSDQQGSRCSPAEERGRHVTRFIDVVLKCESFNIMAELNAGDKSSKV